MTFVSKHSNDYESIVILYFLIYTVARPILNLLKHITCDAQPVLSHAHYYNITFDTVVRHSTADY